MDSYLFYAGILCLILGLVHSILGEFLIFKKKRKSGSWIPTNGSKALSERHLRIIWASWHVVSVFGWCLGAILIKMAHASTGGSGMTKFHTRSIAYSMLVSSLLVLVGTKGKHPGWIVLLIIAILLMY